jgi:hypothetical protein
MHFWAAPSLARVPTLVLCRAGPGSGAWVRGARALAGRYPSKADASRLLSHRFTSTFAALLLAQRAVQFLALPPAEISQVLGTLGAPGGGSVSLAYCLERVSALVRVYRASRPVAPWPDPEPDGAHGLVESVVTWCLGDDSRVSAQDVRVLVTDVWGEAKLPPRVFLRLLTKVLAHVHVPDVRAALSDAVTQVCARGGPVVLERGLYIQAAAVAALRAGGDALVAASLTAPWGVTGPLVAAPPTILPEVLLAAAKHALASGTWRLCVRQQAEAGAVCMPTDG